MRITACFAPVIVKAPACRLLSDSTGRLIVAFGAAHPHAGYNISFRTHIILTDIAIAVFVVVVHGMYVGMFAFMLGADVPSSLALALISGLCWPAYNEALKRRGSLTI